MASSELEKLKEQLAAEMSRNKVAAQYGLTLIQENQSLKAALKTQTTEHEKVAGQHLQQIHLLTGKLDIKDNELKLLAAELDTSREAYDHLKMKLIDNESELHRQMAAVEKDRNRLDFLCLEKDNEIGTLKKTVEDLEEKVKEAALSACSSYSDDTNSFEQSLILENQMLMKQKTDLEEKLLEMQQELSSMIEKEENMRNAQKVMEEEMAYQESKLADCLALKHQLQEENEELKSEIETMKLGEVDMKRRGNSLFGEVEDNRKALENEVKKLRSMQIDLIQKDEENQQEIKRMKYQITRLLSMCDQKVDANYVQNLTQDLLQARGEVEELTAKLKNNTERHNSLEYSNMPCQVERTPSCNANSYEFMSVLIEERNQKIEDLTSKLESVSLAKTTLSNRVIHAERQLYHAEKRNDSLKAELMKLKLEMEDQKKNTLKSVKSTVQKVKIEKIPGFQEKTNTLVPESRDEDLNQKSVEHVTSLPEEKENRRVISPIVPKEGAVSKVKEGVKKVQFAVSDSETDEKEISVKPSRVAGKKTNVSYTFISSENASRPDQCAQQ